MSCGHCLGEEVPGFTCAFCLGNDGCAYHGVCPHGNWREAAEDMERAGNRLHSLCDVCASPIAACDMAGCTSPAFKRIEADPRDDREVFYFCENHGAFAEELHENALLRDELAIYQPGPEGCACDYPH